MCLCDIRFKGKNKRKTEIPNRASLFFFVVKKNFFFPQFHVNVCYIVCIYIQIICEEFDVFVVDWIELTLNRISLDLFLSPPSLPLPLHRFFILIFLKLTFFGFYYWIPWWTPLKKMSLLELNWISIFKTKIFFFLTRGFFLSAFFFFWFVWSVILIIIIINSPTLFDTPPSHSSF